MSGATVYEPDPIANNQPAVWGLVVEDMQARDVMGREKYGTPLQPFNGRDALWDAYQEVLDLSVYLRQAIFEKEAKKNVIMSEFTTAFNAQMAAIQAVNTGNGFTASNEEFIAKLVEEVNEVGEALECENPSTLVMELADVCIAVMFYASENNLDLAQAIEQKNIYNSTRGWKHGKGE
jgi:NTP pyrophosphatase (non-canonical NTP hydrolase)